jgi:hypothetical protein
VESAAFGVQPPGIIDGMTVDVDEPTPHRPRWLIRLSASIGRWDRPRAAGPVLDPLVVAGELNAWVQDPSRWSPRAAADWRSLLDDVVRSWSQLGPRLAEVAAVSETLNALRIAGGAEGLMSTSNRPAIEQAARVLQSALSSARAIDAAVDDLLDAAQHSRRPESLDTPARWRLALLASVSEDHGHDWAVVAERMRRAMEWYREAPTSDIISEVQRVLRGAPATGHSVVWLAINHASAWGQSPNPSVQLFDGDWLLSVLANWSGPRQGVPPELAADPERLPQLCQRIDADLPPGDQLPVAFVRIDLGEGLVAGARERAMDILDLLIARASSLQGGTNWRAAGVCLHYVDGEAVFESALSLGDPDVYSRLTRGDILNDPTAETIRHETVRLRGHLPVADERLHAALRLSKWLSEARTASPAARLVLSGRVLEQVARWTDLSVPKLVHDHLAWAWAWGRIGRELRTAGTAAVLRLPGAHAAGGEQEREKFLLANREILGVSHDGARPRAQPWRTLERLDWLVDQHPAESEIGDYLREIQGRLADGVAARAWIEEALGELKVLNARAVRTRNSIVHGGPLVAEVAETIVATHDSLASQALEWATEALALGTDLGASFASHRLRFVDAFARLRAGVDPASELIAATENTGG